MRQPLYIASLSAILFIGASCNNNNTSTSAATDSITDRPILTMPADSLVPADNINAKSDDAKLIEELIESMHGGIVLIKQAGSKGVTPAVKTLAKKLATAHTVLTKDLEALAAKKGWQYPAGPSEVDTNKAAGLAKETGKDYEKDWLNTLKKKYEANIKKLAHHKTTDTDVQAAAANGLQKLHELLNSTEVVEKGVK